MHEIDGVGHQNGRFVKEDLTLSRPPTQVTDDWLNAVQDELLNVITAAGLTPSKANNAQLLEVITGLWRSVGSQSGAEFVTASLALTAADAGKYLFSNANNLVYTLPDPASLPLGAKFRFAQGNLTSGGSINAPSGVTIGNITDGGTVTTIAMAQRTEFVLTVVSATAYQLTRIAGGGAYTQSLTATGWQRLPSGLIIQWGTSASIAADTRVTVTYPIAFPNACFGAYPVYQAPSTILDHGSSFGVANIGLTTFQIESQAIALPFEGLPARWFAIGY